MKRSNYLAMIIFIVISNQLHASDGLNEPILPIAEPQNINLELVKLGYQLFHDKKLSKNGKISCANCHDLNSGGDDGLSVSKGVNDQFGTINASTVFNSSLNFKNSWSGRFESLMAQINASMLNPNVMGSTWEHTVSVLKQDPHYIEQFSKNFSDGITAENIKIAIVSFEQNLLTPNSRFDQYLRGYSDAITNDELAGYKLFKQYGCISCHQGMAVGGNIFQKLGVMKDYFTDIEKITTADLGRYHVTQKERDRFVFRVPSLRNVALTAPYLHDGSLDSLDATVEIMMIYQLDIYPIKKDIELIVDFLKTLTGQYQGVPL